MVPQLLIFVVFPLAWSEHIIEYTDPKLFLTKCIENKHNQSCNTFKCFSRKGPEDLRLMNRMICSTDSDCLNETSGFKCREYTHGLKFCDCPYGMAYNAMSCKCQYAKICPSNNKNNSTTEKPYSCHNGLMCPHENCLCKDQDLNRVLYEPHGKFCVSASSNPNGDFRNLSSGANGEDNTTLIVICTILILVVLLSIMGYYIRKNMTCEKGDYKCEESEDAIRRDQDEHHVAAWDLPSLDYLTEEEAMKYIKKERSSPDGGSLPEYEQSHINAGYISDHN